MRYIHELKEEWKFKKLEHQIDENQYIIEDGELVTLPHTWNMNGNVDRMKCLYQHKITISPEYKEHNLYLEFLGANSVCRVFLNGLYIGEHRGGYSTFRFNITQFYDWNRENVLSVYVDNSETMDASPLMGDFTIYGGLYRGVNLVCTHKNHFDMEYWGTSGVIIQTDVKDAIGIIDLDLHIVAIEDVQIRIEVCDSQGIIKKVWTGKRNDTSVRLEITEPELWKGKEAPTLNILKAYIEKDDIIFDMVELSFGFRKLSFSAENGFYLNGQHLFINGVAKHQDFESIGNAISEMHMHKDMQLIKEIGANAVRLSHYQHDQLMYNLCDNEGMVVWAEIPMLSMPEVPGVIENALSQLHELVLQNIHHPSIVMWGVQNEIAMQGESITMYQGVQTLNDCVHELVPNAITASANMYYVKNSSQLNHITDIQGYNLYYGWYYGEEKELADWIEEFHKDNPNVAIGISEYGADCNLAFHSETPKVKDYSEEFQSLYHERSYAAICSKNYVWGSFVWNMFDFGSFVRNEGGSIGRNNKGLVTFDRQTPKDAFFYYKANWSKDPFVHICEKRFLNRHKEDINIKIYSNCPEVSLYFNGELFGNRIGDNHHIFNFNQIKLQNGWNEIVAVAGEVRDTAVFHLQEKVDESYVFVDSDPGINVENWFIQQEGEVDCFPEGCFSILDTVGDLLENEEAWCIIKEKVPKATERATKGAPVTLLWVLNKLRGIYTEEEVKKLNERLITIHK